MLSLAGQLSIYIFPKIMDIPKIKLRKMIRRMDTSKDNEYAESFLTCATVIKTQKNSLNYPPIMGRRSQHLTALGSPM